MRAMTAMAMMRVVRATTTMSEICDVREHGARWPTRAPGGFLINLPQYHGAFLKVYGAFSCVVIGRQGSRSCGYFHAKMRGTRRTAKSDRSKPALSPAIHSFCSRPPSPCSKMVHVLWFMFCALGQSFPRPLPWESQTAVSPRLCCVLAAMLASSLPPGGACLAASAADPPSMIAGGPRMTLR